MKINSTGEGLRNAMTKIVKLFTIVLIGTASTSLGIPTASAEPSKKTPVSECIDVAVERGLDNWTCIGGTLNYLVKENKDGKSEKVAKSEQVAGSPERTPAKGAKSSADDYDTWCENGSICHRVITDYIGETKGNAAYGNETGAVGAFDIINRIALNGRQAQFTVTFIYDAGPRPIELSRIGVNCREEVPLLPDVNCGLFPGNIWDGEGVLNSRHQFDTWYSDRLDDAAKYHGDVIGSFRPLGWNWQRIGKLKSLSWECPENDAICYFP